MKKMKRKINLALTLFLFCQNLWALPLELKLIIQSFPYFDLDDNEKKKVQSIHEKLQEDLNDFPSYHLNFLVKKEFFHTLIRYFPKKELDIKNLDIPYFRKLQERMIQDLQQSPPLMLWVYDMIQLELWKDESRPKKENLFTPLFHSFVLLPPSVVKDKLKKVSLEVFESLSLKVNIFRRFAPHISYENSLKNIELSPLPTLTPPKDGAMKSHQKIKEQELELIMQKLKLEEDRRRKNKRKKSPYPSWRPQKKAFQEKTSQEEEAEEPQSWVPKKERP